MKRVPLVFLALLAFAASAWSQEVPEDLVPVEGGNFKCAKSNYHDSNVTVSDFYIGKHEVTQKQWSEMMGNNPSQFKGENLPVEMVSWYDCIEYCNRRSAKEGLQPYYTIDKQTKDPNNLADMDDLRWTVTMNAGANGYRLPTEAEWEYAAGGGQKSKSSAYSGGDALDKVAWYWQNCGDAPLGGAWNWPAIENNHGRTHEVGEKAPNELGLHDMSGNVREWCWDWIGDVEVNGPNPSGAVKGPARVWKGGGWVGGDFCCEISFRGGFESNSVGQDQGFRICRSVIKP